MAKKTHFVVENGGTLKRLLSIREQANDSLLIATHLEGLYDISGAPLIVRENRIAEYRHKLHVSNKSSYNTVHLIVKRADGSYIDRHLLTSAIRDGRFQPIYVRSVVHPSVLPEHDLSAKGPVVHLPTYNPELCAMHYALWFTSPAAWRQLNLVAPYSVAWFGFRRFMVFIPFCYSKGPSPKIGRTIDGATTSAEKRSAEHIALGNRVGPAEGAPAHAVVGYVIRDSNRI